MKKGIVVILICIILILLSGCTDYRSLDDLTVVAGMAIDVDENTPDIFQVTFEIVDMTSAGSDQPMQSKLLTTQGRDITEAVYNAHLKLHRNMYFGNAEIVVVSQQLAKNQSLDLIVDPLLRDYEIRDNLYIFVSGEDTAKEIIEPDGQIVSFFLNENIADTKFSANSTKPRELYSIYSLLAGHHNSLVLPIIRFSDKENKEIALDGAAVFSGSKMVGRIENKDMPYYLLASANLVGGSFHYAQEDEGGNEKYTALAVRQSKVKHSYQFDGQKFTFELQIDMITATEEFSEGWGKLTGPLIRQLEKDASAMLDEDVRTFIETVQSEFSVDIVGFGDHIRDHDPSLWQSIEENWPEYVKQADVSVQCKMLINDTGLIKSY